jgi:hypothetical protein
LIAVPEPKHSSLCILILRLPDHPLAITVLNFGREDVEEELDLRDLKGVSKEDLHAQVWVDILSERHIKDTGIEGRLRLRLPALSGTTVLGKSN